jgi:predicted phage terminase large subunit-like protein
VSRSARKLLNGRLRRDLTCFVQRCVQTVAPGRAYQHNWHIEVIASHLERCLAGEITRLIITLPPRSLKSICTSVAFPAWALGHDPALRIICASYTGDLAAKHARDCRAVMESSWYRGVFPNTRIDPAKNSELEFATRRQGFRLATSVGGTLTGRGGNLLIVDDPLKASDAMSESKRQLANDWFRNTLYSRLDDKSRDRIVIVMQRLHVDDLVGNLLERDEGWVHLNLPALAEADERFDLGDGRIFTRAAGEALHPEREPRDTLERIKHTLGSYDFAAQFQQNPVPLGGGLIKWDWFRFYDAPPERQEEDFVTQSWDTASKADEINDYSVCTTWLRRGEDHYLLDVSRSRLEYPYLKQHITDLAKRHQADAVLIEDKGSGIQLIQDLQHEGQVRPIGIIPQQDKVTRMSGQSAKIEAGYVLLPEKAGWLDDFQVEILQFPRGRHDDQVDSLSQYLAWEQTHRPIEGECCAIESPFYRELINEFGEPSSRR